VPDTAALISDFTEQSEICAQSLLARSKPSPARTWSQRWKRDSWTQHLSGRILKPSHGQTFVTAWTSALSVIRASHLVPPASDSEQKIHDTSGHLLQPELLQCDQVSVSLKTSRDISRWGCPTSLKTWSDWVTERRGAWRARVNAARLTRGKGFSSWPTIRASEYKDVGPVGSKSHDHMLGKHYLCAVVTQEEASWPTPCAMEAEKAGLFNKGQMGQSLSAMANRGEMYGQAAPANWPTPQANEIENPNKEYRSPTNAYRGGKKVQPMLADVCKHGQAAPASSSSLGSRQGLWLTPRANEPDSDPNFAARNADRGAHCHGTLSSQTKQWATPQAKDHKSGHRDPTIVQYKQLNVEVEAKASGKLNPRWVETLMGLPIGWTMPSCTRPVTIAPTSCDSFGMALSQPAQSERSDFLLAS
jgi:hypothetical protein